MSAEAIVSPSNQIPIKLPLTDTGLVATDQQNSPASRIEGERHSPFPSGRAEAQLFHVGVFRSLQRVDTRPPELRSKLLKQSGQRQNLILDSFRQPIEFGFELISNLNRPRHSFFYYMICTPYAL